MAPTGQQKVVFITGCSAGGIGFALSEEFAARGCLVYATSRKLESMVGFQSPNIRTLVLDVTTDGDDIERTVQTILAETGKIDIVVNNAGAMAVCPIAEATIDRIRSAFELNTFAALRVSNAVIPSMFKRREGLIVNIGSVVGQVTTPWNTLYCAAKAALHAITEGLAMECKPFGVKVMLIAPGAVTSNIVKNQAAIFSLSPTTMYKEFEPKIIRRMNASQHLAAMDTKEFARKVVAQWLPRQWVLGKLFKSLVGYSPSTPKL